MKGCEKRTWEVIDIVIPLGRGSKNKNLELRYSLRSLEKHVKDIGEVFIIGERPDWLTNIYHIPCPDISGNAARNILEKALTACRCVQVSETFAFLNDDYFFTRDFSLKNYPYYFKCDLEHTVFINRSDYRKHATATLKALSEKSLPTKNFDVHYPILYEKEKLTEATQAFSWGGLFGLTLKSIYCNYHKIEGVHRLDCKEPHAHPKDWWYRFIKDKECFSVQDPSITPAFKEFLAELYPEKSRYEI